MPNERAYVDTSVLGAYYCPELLSAAAEDALRRIEVPVISILSEVEFSSLISKKRRLKEVNQGQANEILDLFATHVAEGFFRRMVLTAEHYLKARQLISSVNIKLHMLDALHLAAAAAESLTLLTADQGLATAARRHKCGVNLII